jgi:hypothetical protein
VKPTRRIDYYDCIFPYLAHLRDRNTLPKPYACETPQFFNEFLPLLVCTIIHSGDLGRARGKQLSHVLDRIAQLISVHIDSPHDAFVSSAVSLLNDRADFYRWNVGLHGQILTWFLSADCLAKLQWIFDKCHISPQRFHTYILIVHSIAPYAEDREPIIFAAIHRFLIIGEAVGKSARDSDSALLLDIYNEMRPLTCGPAFATFLQDA